MNDGEARDGGVPVLEPERFLASDEPHFAVIDIGSNSVRLVVYDRFGRAPFARFNEKSLCGLGGGIRETGELSADSVDCTLRAIRRFCSIARAMDVGRIDVLATEAVRRASNGQALVEAIRERSGLEPQVLSGDEEGRLSALGVISGIHGAEGLVGDIGGGSLELTPVPAGRTGDASVSMPLGALPVAAMMAEDAAAAQREIDAVLEERVPESMSAPVFYAVGGGWRALARIRVARGLLPVPVVHGLEVDAGELRDHAREIVRMGRKELAALPGIPSRRVETLPAAALVLDRVLKRLGPEKVVFSALGVREGWLYDQLAPEDKARDPLVEGAQAFGVPRARVPAFAPALVRWTDGLFPDETAAERRIRVAACALSDIGWRDHVDVRAAECFLRLLQFPFIGIMHRERVMLGATIHARYNGKPDDTALRPAIGLLSPEEARRAQVLGRAFLLGYRLSGSVPEILDGAALRIERGGVCIEVRGTEAVPDSDAVRNRLRQLAKACGMRRTEIRSVVA